ncbi:Uncharacterised protein [Yersinia massiliensis]|nr:Uncharacterised protein [Yersinia massiliensis]
MALLTPPMHIDRLKRPFFSLPSVKRLIPSMR